MLEVAVVEGAILGGMVMIVTGAVVVEVEVLEGSSANELRDRVWRVLENSVTTGFQMATASGERMRNK